MMPLFVVFLWIVTTGTKTLAQFSTAIDEEALIDEEEEAYVRSVIAKMMREARDPMKTNKDGVTDGSPRPTHTVPTDEDDEESFVRSMVPQIVREANGDVSLPNSTAHPIDKFFEEELFIRSVVAKMMNENKDLLKTFRVGVSEDDGSLPQSTGPSRKDSNNDGASGDAVLTTSLLTGGAVVVVSVSVAIVSVVRMKTKRGVLTNISDAEVTQFLEGRHDVSSEERFGSSPGWDFGPYNNKFDVDRNVLTFDVKRFLGSGAYGKVFKGRITKPETHRVLSVAVKTVNPGIDPRYLKALLSELKILAYLDNGHPNVVQLVAACTKGMQQGEVLIALELCPAGSLLSVIRGVQKTECDEESYTNLGDPQVFCEGYENVTPMARNVKRQMFVWGYEIADGMTFLAESRVVHGDLSLRNVLLASDGMVRISDFGLARQLVDYNYLKTDRCPLPWKWMAVETLKEMKFSTASDVWSYGITLLELFSLGSVPYPGLSWTQDFLRMLDEGLRPGTPALASVALYELMLQCWDPEPRKSPKFASIKREIGAFL